jgi:cytochrome c peroxidase
MKPIFVVALGFIFVSACEKKSDKAEATPAAPSASALANVPKGPSADELKLPHDLGKMPIPEANPMSPEKVELGRKLFFDARLSVDGSRSCYSCHLNEDGSGGKDPIAIGAKEKLLTRHSPALWNVGYLPRLYWDGRADSLEAQGTAAWAGGNMGVGKENLEKKAKEIGALPEYKAAFKAVFPEKGATAETVMQAVSAFERTLVCDDTAYDRFAKGDKSALTEPQKRGLEVFMGKAGCVACHAPPFFSTSFLGKDGAYFNVGVGYEGKAPEAVDVGRKKVSESDADMGAFKVPSLRNVSKSAPYFHDGSKKTLEEAVRFMANGGFKNANLSPLLTDRKLTDAEIGSIVTFLGALDCTSKIEAPAGASAGASAAAPPSPPAPATSK